MSTENTPTTPPVTTGHIKSFVHRRSHITPGQQEALERLLPLWAIDYQAQHLDPAKAFGRDAPLVLEIGFGMGKPRLRLRKIALTITF